MRDFAVALAVAASLLVGGAAIVLYDQNQELRRENLRIAVQNLNLRSQLYSCVTPRKAI